MVNEPGSLAEILSHLDDSIDTASLSEHLDLNPDISFAALVAFAAVDEFGHYGRAAKFLGKQQQGLRQHVKNLEEVMNTQLIGTGPQGEYQAVGPIGRELRDRARLILYQYGAIGRLSDKSVKIHYLSQHCFFMAPVEARLDGLMDLRPTTLSEEFRSMPRFHDNVIVPLAAGMIDLAIGMLPGEHTAPAELVTGHYLYSYQQEAMVPAPDPRERIDLAELVAEARLLVPPVHFRSRMQLEDEITREVPDDPGPSARVRRESSGTKVLIQYGINGLGTVVVPSSLAYPFYHGNDYGGPTSAAFKWIPVCKPSGERLYQDVYALTRRVRDQYSDQIAMILKLVRQQVIEMGLEKNVTVPAVDG